MSGTLYLVPTPIGNLADITRRAEQILGQVDMVACEDTRRTLGLMNHLGLKKPLWSYHAHSAPRKDAELIHQLQEGRTVALVTDAGTPGLSDPGTALVEAAIDAGVPVVPLPGPCAAITALVGSGLPTDRFFFIGFLPRRTARARRALEDAARARATVVIYESPFRTVDTLKTIETAFGPQTRCAVARELSKVHEEFVRGPVAEVRAAFETRPARGEVTIVFSPGQREVL